MAVKLGQIATGQRLGKKTTAQQLSMLSVGARQGCEDTAGSPCGDMTLADGIEHILRKGLDEG